MGLKQSIVIVNEYTVKSSSGKGSRGSSPGAYVTRYMARDGATETLTPVRLNQEDNSFVRYMARRDATEELIAIHGEEGAFSSHEYVPKLKQKLKEKEKYGGVAFCEDDISMSDEKLKRKSEELQQAFDRGKTVLKTVLSFDEEYLKEMGVLDQGFVYEKEGDYRGNLDQMKLRLAIRNGMDKMGQDYDDLAYIACIQVDTANVHCHLATVDLGVGNLASDGTQRGKIHDVSKRKLRRGIDMSLEGHQQIRMMTSNIAYDRRNALCYVKKFTHKAMLQNGNPQFLMACLPQDKRLWRASTNAKEMQKPNSIVREYVTQILDQPDSGYKEALSGITEYALSRAGREDLTTKEYRALIDNGRDKIVNDCMNGVYAVLKSVPESNRSVRTPMLETMSMDYEQMHDLVEDDPMIEFGFRLRSYSNRLSHHKKEMHKYRDTKEVFKQTADVSEDAKPLLDFFEFEEDYHSKCMCKYQHFLAFLPAKDDYEDEFEDLMKYKAKLENLKKMSQDKSLNRMTENNAEDYGLKVYDQHGGRFVKKSPQIIERRIENMEYSYLEQEQDFKTKLLDYGMTLDEKGVSLKKPYTFDEVKALDIHHMSYDFTYDISVSVLNINTFVDVANKRYDLFQKAANYLKQTDQEDRLKSLGQKDIEYMKEVADKMTIEPKLVTSKPSTSGGKHIARTTPLDITYEQDMEQMVKAVVHTTQIGG